MGGEKGSVENGDMEVLGFMVIFGFSIGDVVEIKERGERRGELGIRVRFGVF